MIKAYKLLNAAGCFDITMYDFVYELKTKIYTTIFDFFQGSNLDIKCFSLE